MLSVSRLITNYLKSRGTARIFGLCGGHIQPLWDEIFQSGIQIVDARDERAAVHMAQAQAELTGTAGVALVTAGPGFANAITGIANASVSRVPVVVLTGSPPMPQRGKGALQELDHIDMVATITRSARLVKTPTEAIDALHEAFSAAGGRKGEMGPAVIDFPTDILRSLVGAGDRGFKKPADELSSVQRVDSTKVDAAFDLIWSAERPVVISGRGAVSAASELTALLQALDCPYLETVESRGLVAGDHPCFMPSMRARLMGEADLIVTVGRRLDFQLAYGSPAVFRRAKFVRIGASRHEVRDNRSGDAEIIGPIDRVLTGLTERGGIRKPRVDRAWVDDLRREDRKRRDAFERKLSETPPGGDGAMHPYRLLGEIKKVLPADAIMIADGGDILSFARQAFSDWAYLDSGPFGCLGVGVPYGISAALTYPDRQVVVLTGDGAFGFNAMELDTCRRTKAGVVLVVANNAAWNIERQDQLANYAGRLAGVDLADCDYAGMARALGIHAERIDDAAALPRALEQAFQQAPALLDVTITRDAVSPDFRSGIAAVPDLQALSRWHEQELKLKKNGI